MGQRMPVEPTRTHAKTLRTRLDDVRAGDANLRIDANYSGIAPVSVRFRTWAREAMRRTGTSQKVFAINAKQSESVISEAFAGTRNFSGDWVAAQDDAFIGVFAQVVAESGTATSKRTQVVGLLTEAVRLLAEDVA